jgi:hypothetical protein
MWSNSLLKPNEKIGGGGLVLQLARFIPDNVVARHLWMKENKKSTCTYSICRVHHILVM